MTCVRSRLSADAIPDKSGNIEPTIPGASPAFLTSWRRQNRTHDGTGAVPAFTAHSKAKFPGFTEAGTHQTIRAKELIILWFRVQIPVRLPFISNSLGDNCRSPEKHAWPLLMSSMGASLGLIPPLERCPRVTRALSLNRVEPCRPRSMPSR